MKEYLELLKEAMIKVPKKKTSDERFKIPEVRVMLEGNKTIIKNFNEIVTVFRRDPKHVAKYLFRELAAPGNIQGPYLILQRKLSIEMIRKKVEQYAKDNIYCKVCRSPDTRLVKENRLYFIICDACGAKSPVR